MRGCALGALAAAVAVCAGPALADAALDVLRGQPPPRFAAERTLPRLTMWCGAKLSFDVRVELAEKWGYALYFGRTHKGVLKKLEDRTSEYSRILALAARDPKRYPLHVIVAPAFTIREYINELPEETFARTAAGELVGGKRVWSPLAPDSVFERIADEEINMLKPILQRAPIAYITNGGEYGLGHEGHNRKYLEQDRRVVQAKGRRSWFEFLSQEKGRQEGIVADRLRAAVPGRVLYIYYHADGCPHRNRYPGWERWAFDYKYVRHVTDLPSSSIYYGHYNTGFAGECDMLTMALNAAAQQIALGEPLSYNWVCGGWQRDKGYWTKEPVADVARYMGFLKCWYAAGMIGGISGYFAYDPPENWIGQFAAHGRVAALFSHLEDFLRNGDLVPGPNKHRWSQDLPAYELPTGDDTARAVARKHREREEWLVVAWAATGDERTVRVELPGAGAVKLFARPAGSVYIVKRRGAELSAALVDQDPLHPTANLAG